jgi:ammonia channel protein AmtB
MLKVINIFTPVKVDEASEEAGLDESLHGEHAYEEMLAENRASGSL